MANLRLVNLNKIYDNGFQAVYNFNLDIKQGEFIVFVGPSGCGKSTTLRMIAGLENITKGEFYIDDELTNEKSPRQRGVAMVFQTYALYPHLSVYDNLAFGLTLRGLDQDIIEQRVLKTAKILGLTDYLDRMPRALSGGQRQRVAVGRAIIRHVDIFLMDEPLSNLDAKQRVTMRSEIIDIHRKVGATTIYVTHDQTEAMTMADRIVVMKDGYIQQIGSPYDVYFNPTNMFVAGFIGEPPMNFVNTTMDNGVISLDGCNDKFDFGCHYPQFARDYQGRQVVIGFRPEGCSLDTNVDGLTIDCTVELTELLGDTVNVYINYGTNKLIVKVAPEQMPQMDSKFKFVVPWDSIYLFDKKTEKVIEKK